MTPGTYNLALYRGDTYSWTIKVWQDAAHTVPTDLTGATAKAEIRDRTGGTTIVPLTCTLTPPNTIVMKLATAQWTGMPPAGVWDLQITYADGTVTTVLAGSVTVTPDVTDSVAAAAEAATPAVPPRARR